MSVERRLLLGAVVVFATGCNQKVEDEPEECVYDCEPDPETCEDQVAAFRVPDSPAPWVDTVDGHPCEHVPVEPDCVDGWCLIPAGCFVMGSPEDEPGRGLYTEDQVSTTLTRSFWMMQTEVTQGLWSTLIAHNPSTLTEEKFRYPGEFWSQCLAEDCPVGAVSWLEAIHFANLLSESEGHDPCYELVGCAGTPGDLSDPFDCEDVVGTPADTYDCTGFRLPTEAEFEYAARAGTRTAYFTGEVPDEIAARKLACVECVVHGNAVGWHCGNSQDTTHPVARLLPNQWGLYDTMGNVFEWVLDEDVTTPGKPPWIDPLGEVTPTGLNPTRRSIKGGSFNHSLSLQRSADSNSAGWNTHGVGLGFRLVRTAGE